ncbi:hypothetical protein PHIN3_373 [Sinorhizobium phage phiN3]|uniref:Uncharacterized protein n=1 Tax=Sinorhizobium phage phiN3 TaxID=1647405 RepID=A0A0F6WD41_9CAUD|nr:hypothetical protein AVT40_gp160 [Sinorhizobium phage phiN3]AKF13636.1 hypothetical protein PHIN3_373 [Sinorhizobium phage phiN3]
MRTVLLLEFAAVRVACVETEAKLRALVSALSFFGA